MKKNAINLPARSYIVRYQTQLCDAAGKVIRELQSGHNEITDWGMDTLQTKLAYRLMSYLHLSDTLGTAARIGTGSGTTLTLTITSPTNIAVVASAGFFQSGDVGETLSIDDLGQELKITAFADSTHVTCSTRPGAWIPGSAPGSGPFSAFGVHFTSTNVLANQTQRYNTYDTSASNYNTGANPLNDSGNSRFINQNIFLSGVVSGSAWTVNQLGWSDGNGSNYVFGKANLASADTVPVGNRYLVQLQVFEAYTPIDISSVSVNWGATIGTYDLAIRTENIWNAAFLIPCLAEIARHETGWWGGSFVLAGIKWAGDSGFPNTHPAEGLISNTGSDDLTDAAYTSGSHTVTRTWTISDSVAISAATGITVGQSNGTQPPSLTLFCNSGTITKPAGYWCALPFQIFWTRNFTN